MQISTEAFVGLLAALVAGGFGWMWTLAGRQSDTQRGLSAHEASCAQRQKNLDERHRNIERALAGIDAKLDRLMSGGSAPQ